MNFNRINFETNQISAKNIIKFFEEKKTEFKNIFSKNHVFSDKTLKEAMERNLNFRRFLFKIRNLNFSPKMKKK